MITALCSGITAFGFLGFLKSAIFLVGYISSNQLFKDKIIINDDYISFILSNPNKVIHDFRKKHHF